MQFDPTAIAWTEAPATVRGLAKQRFRWAYGTLQCLWKYRRITFNAEYGELGLVALPQVWLFQILLTTLAPVADLLLVWQLVAEYINYAQHVGTYTGDNLRIVGIYYAIFIVVDLLAAMVGLCDGKGRGLAAACGGCRCSASAIARSCITWWCARYGRRCADPLWAGASWSATAPSRPELSVGRA